MAITTARVSQEALEYIAEVSAVVRESQVVVEYAIPVTTTVRESQAVIEYAPDISSTIRLSQHVIEYITRAEETPPVYGGTVYKIRRLRRSPHLSNENRRLFFSQFKLDVETGVGQTVAPGVNPEVQLRWSDNGGRTWSEPMPMPVGKIGAFRQRVIWNRLGSARSRTFEISMSSPNRWRVFDAFLMVK